MKPQSAKSKGRTLCKYVKERILKRFISLKDDDIKVTSSGANGEDLQFSPKAREYMPISLECKNRKAFAIYKDYAQAQSNAKEYTPVLVIKQNKCKPLAVVDLDVFLMLSHGAYLWEYKNE